MGIFRLLLANARTPGAPRVVAEHLDPVWLKQRGYEIARSLGDNAALWTPRSGLCPAHGLELRCRNGHALTIINA
jgi:hypothetical protein